MAQPLLINAFVDIESTRIAPAVAAGTRRKQLYFVSRGSTSADVPVIDSITVGGVVATFEGGAPPGSTQSQCAVSCFSLNEAQLAAMSGTAVVIASSYYAGRQIIQVGSYQNMNQTAAGVSGFWASGASSATGGLVSLQRRAESVTVAVVYAAVLSTATMTNPAGVTVHSSPASRATIGYAADTARVADAAFTIGSSKNAILAINFTDTPAQLINSTNSGANTLSANVVNTASVTGFAPTSGTVGSLTLAYVSTTAGVTTFTIPWFEDAQIYPELGASQTLTLTEGANSATFSAPLNYDADYYFVRDVASPGNADVHKFGYHFSLAGFPPANDDKIISIKSQLTVAADTGWTAPAVPVTATLVHWVKSTGVAYVYTVNVSVDGEIISVVSALRITAKKIEAVKITAIKITAIKI
jgi:hypothetical protein